MDGCYEGIGRLFQRTESSKVHVEVLNMRDGSEAVIVKKDKVQVDTLILTRNTPHFHKRLVPHKAVVRDNDPAQKDEHVEGDSTHVWNFLELLRVVVKHKREKAEQN